MVVISEDEDKSYDASAVEAHQTTKPPCGGLYRVGGAGCLWRFLEPVGEGFDTPAVHVPIVAVFL